MEPGQPDQYSLPQDWNEYCDSGAYFCDCSYNSNECRLYRPPEELFYINKSRIDFEWGGGGELGPQMPGFPERIYNNNNI